MSHVKKRYKCPCCNRPIDAQLGIDPNEVRLGANQQALFDLLKKHPHGLAVDVIRERIFHTARHGGCYQRSQSIVAVVACHVNKKIKAWGLKIKGTGGPGSVYRLIRL